MICCSLHAVRRTKDGLSLSIIRNKFFMATIGLNFARATGVGKIVRNTKLYSRVTNFVVVDDVEGLE